MIASLPDRIAGLPPALHAACAQIFEVDVTTGVAEPPASMQPWVAQHFGALEEVRRQTLVTVLNRLTLEGALFNPLRARRPSGPAGDDAALEAWIAEELADDIFAAPLRDTPADTFGRIRGRHCVSASNVAKYAGWHGLVIFDEPHPLGFGPEQLRDYLDVAWRWLHTAHAHDPQAIFPIITWNCLPKSGATIMHGHMQMALTRRPYARQELWRRAANGYRATRTRDYFADLYAIHDALGLALPGPAGVRAFAHLTPLRNRELVLLADGLSEGFADALYALLRALIDRQSVRSFNAAILPPPLVPDAAWQGLPLVARVADRGSALTSRSDLGAMELFATGCITVDPFDLAAHLQR